MKVYTKAGDSGTSLLIGSRKRISKAAPVFEILGLADEINACLGLAGVGAGATAEKDLLLSIQRDFFSLGSFVAGLKISTTEVQKWQKKTENLEKLIDKYSQKLPPLKFFILPGGSETAANIHLARVKVRTLERLMVFYVKQKSNKRLEFLLPYINRMSDLLFVLARYVNMNLGIKDTIWKAD